jgi:hypothetical protein
MIDHRYKYLPPDPEVFLFETTLRLPFAGKAKTVRMKLDVNATIKDLKFVAGRWCQREGLLATDWDDYHDLYQVQLFMNGTKLQLGDALSSLGNSAIDVLLHSKIRKVHETKKRYGRCQRCQECRPSSWIECPKCGKWVGKGCSSWCWPDDDATACMTCSSLGGA